MKPEMDINHQGRAVMVYTPMTRRVFANYWSEIRTSASRHACIIAETETLTPDSVRQSLEKHKPDLVIAAGGDGTINLCIRAMKNGHPLACLPLGTANDLLNSLGEPSNLTHHVDCIRINNQPFCTTGGLGIPSAVSRRVNQLRQGRFERPCRRAGHHIYALVAAQLVLLGKTRPQWVEIEWEDVISDMTKGMRLQTNTLFVANQATFGRSLSVVSNSINDDGRFEICVFRNGGYWRDIAITARIARAASQNKSYCHILSTPSARITTTEPMPFFGDGEIITTSRQFDLEIAAGALNILNLDWSLKINGKNRIPG